MTSTLLPAEVTYGTVVGQFILAVGDATDPDDLPDRVPAQGYVLLIPSPTRGIKIVNTNTKVTVIPETIRADLDANGSLFKRVLATDDPAENPSGWTYHVEFHLTNGALPAFDTPVPTDGVVDLTEASPVPASGGVFYIQGPAGPPGTPQPPDGTPDGYFAVSLGGEAAYVQRTAADLAYDGAGGTFTGSAGDVQTALRQLDTEVATIALTGGGGGGGPGGGLVVVGPDANGVLTGVAADGDLTDVGGVLSYSGAVSNGNPVDGSTVDQIARDAAAAAQSTANTAATNASSALTRVGLLNVIFQHGAPTDPSAYPVGSFVVNVDDSMHLYEIGA